MTSSFIVNALAKRVRAYHEQSFTGLVKVTSHKDHQWFIYYLRGRIVWIKSRTHDFRRWQRHLAVHCPGFSQPITRLAQQSHQEWNYAALAQCVQLNQVCQKQFFKVVEGCITENLFDILQVGTLQYQQSGYPLICTTHPRTIASLPFIFLPQGQAWQKAQQEWLAWEKSGLAKVSPDWAPIMTQPEILKAQANSQTLQTLTTLVDGNTTLRDLAIKIKQPIIPLSKSIFPYIFRKMLCLQEISDIVENGSHGFHPELLQPQFPQGERPSLAAQSIMAPRSASPSLGRTKHLRNTKISLNTPQKIVYIDDSPADSRLMGKMVEGFGYQYTNISDPVQAIPLLIELRPNLIFLDLVMPIINGYEICALIRRISFLQKISVIIVTSNDSIVDRVRAKMVGASGFLAKPIQHDKILTVLNKHLHHVESGRNIME